MVPIEEFRNETKILNGYSCFKVIYGYKKDAVNAEYSSDMKLFQPHMELWVTDKIKCLFHPVFKYKEVLEKYYPLEITTYYGPVTSLLINYKVSILDVRR